jgi:hypothetical protein
MQDNVVWTSRLLHPNDSEPVAGNRLAGFV